MIMSLKQRINEICTKDIIEPQRIHPSPLLSRNRTGDQRRQQTLCDKGDHSFVWRKKLPQTEKPKPQTDLFCKRPENINVKWSSRRNTQIITLSRLSRTSVLPSSSSYLLSMERRRLYPLWLIILLIDWLIDFYFEGMGRLYTGYISSEIVQVNTQCAKDNFYM